MKVCIMGMGYIGFPTACLLANAGHHVVGVDVNTAIINSLHEGQLHIVNEEGLAALAQKVFSDGSLTVCDQPSRADAFIIAVPTPFKHSNDNIRERIFRPEASYQADLGYVISATRAIAPFVQPGNLVILESTVPPGTTEEVVVGTLREEGVDTSQLLVAHAPERVLPGNLLAELVQNDRVIGGLTPAAGEAAAALYRSFVRGCISITDAKTAELVKLMENTYRDVNIALANEFALVCEHLKVNAWEAMSLANRHPRVQFLRPGPGVGGHCIAVDPYFVVEAAPTLTDLIQTARRINRRMPLHVVKLLHELEGNQPVQRVAILGASYKADVGDDRESPSLEIAQLLESEGIEVKVHDPFIARYNRPLEDMLRGAEALLLLTDHAVYASLDPNWVRELVSRPLLVDARGVVSLDDWCAAGFQVKILGCGQQLVMV